VDKDQGLDTKEERLNLTVKMKEYLLTNGHSLLGMKNEQNQK